MLAGVMTLVALAGSGSLARSTSSTFQTQNLADTTWQLVKFQSGDDTSLAPDDKAKYTISFAKNDRVAVRFDCNRGTGTWKSSAPGQLHFGPLALTRAMCLNATMPDRLAKDWASIRSYVLKDGHLFLSLMTDGGVYEFEPLNNESKITGTITYRQRIALTPAASVEVNLLDVSLADAPATSIASLQLIPAGKQVPIPFELQYDAQRINSGHRYAIRVEVFEGRTLRFTNTQVYQVITQGKPKSVDIVVQPVSR